MTIKDFAALKGVTTQAIYKLLKNHATELEGHIEKRKKVKYLDEYAQKYLSDQMIGNPVVVADNQLQQQIDELKEKLERKDILIEKLQQRVQEKDNIIDQIRDEKRLIEQDALLRVEEAVKIREDELFREHRKADQKIQQHYKDEIEQLKKQDADALEAEKNRADDLQEKISALENKSILGIIKDRIFFKKTTD